MEINEVPSAMNVSSPAGLSFAAQTGFSGIPGPGFALGNGKQWLSGAASANFTGARTAESPLGLRDVVLVDERIRVCRE